MSPSRGLAFWCLAELVWAQVMQVPWFFDCSNNPEWSAFRELFQGFRRRFSAPDRDDAAMVTEVQQVLTEANQLGRRYEPNFVQYASDWSVFHICNPDRLSEVPEDLQKNFCFYGFATVQWLGLFGHQHFSNVPGMSEWAHNARGFLNDAAKFNAMHFLESSGWSVTMVELAKSLSNAFMANSDYRVSRDAALPALSEFSGVPRRPPEHTRRPQVRVLKAVAISYHTALIREPLTFWQHMLTHLFDVQSTLHILDVTAKTAQDVTRLHSHCRFIGGSWCGTDERLLQLNALFTDTLLNCHTGDHKARHHFLRSAQEYYELFLQLMGNDAELRSADFFMCGEPVLFCLLLSYFGQPVIGYISTPISVYVGKHDRAEWYQQFYEMTLDDRHIFATTTPIFAEWVAYATGIDLPVIRPICSYTEVSYWPRRQRELLLLRSVSLFWDTECVLNYFAKQFAGDGEPLRFLESTGLSDEERRGYGSFAEFKAAVIYPYSPSQFWFYELYSMAVPLLMPTRESMPLYVSQDYSVCPDFEGHRLGHAPHLVHPHSPFDTDDWAAMTYWASFTDYLTLPHVLHFSSVPDLLRLVETSNLHAISRAMRKVHMQHLGIAQTFWSEALERVASIRKKPRRAQPLEEGFAAPHNLMKDELRDLSTRQPSGGSPARPDGPHRLANDGDTRQDHPHQYHFDMVAAAQASGLPQYVGASHWWVKLRRTARDPEVKLWTRDCCSEIYGRQLFVLLGNSSDVRHAAECAALEVLDDQQVSTICLGTGEYLFVEARPGRAEAEEVAILMLPEVRVLSRD